MSEPSRCICGNEIVDPTCTMCENEHRSIYTVRKIWEARVEGAKAGHAEGYAMAIADVIAWHQGKADHATEEAGKLYEAKLDFNASYWRSVGDHHFVCIAAIQNGAHIGAAKRGERG